MKFISLTCTQCGATMKVDETTKSCSCSYCGNELYVDNEDVNINVTVDGGFDFGYEAEKGRQKAIKEEQFKADLKPILISSIKVIVYYIISIIIANLLLGTLPPLLFLIGIPILLVIINIIMGFAVEKNFWWLAFILLCIIEIQW